MRAAPSNTESLPGDSPQNDDPPLGQGVSDQASAAGTQSGGTAPRPRPKRKRIFWSHFLSLPLNSEAEQATLLQVKDDVAQRFGGTIPASAFIAPPKLHFTLCMLKLPEASDVDAATALLRDLRPQMCRIAAQAGCLSADGRMQVRLAPGLATFEDRSLAKATVLFRRPQDGSPAAQALRDIAALFIDALTATGILCSPLEELQLHMTAVNMRYASSYKKRPKPFDARPLLDTYNAWPPAATESSEAVHLSVLSAPPDDSGYYQCALALPFNDQADAWLRPADTAGHDVADGAAGIATAPAADAMASQGRDELQASPQQHHDGAGAKALAPNWRALKDAAAQAAATALQHRRGSAAPGTA